jgi:hypothetical protein
MGEVTPRTRIEIDQLHLVSEMRGIFEADGIEAAIKHYTVVVASDPMARSFEFQLAAFRALREFLLAADINDFHQWWAETDYDLPGGAR